MSLKKHKGIKHPPKDLNSSEHLITKLVKSHQNEQQTKDISECKYGIQCAHLRAQGKCIYPHRKSHYHFLNIVAPSNCLEDEAEGDHALSKKERKQRKIIQKTISKEIDVAALDKRQQMLKNKKDEDVKKELIQNLGENEKKVIQLASSSNASQFFQKLNSFKNQKLDLYEIKKKAMIQINKKKQILHLEIIDKEYRIANRLIKASLKNKEEESLYELYENINHDSIPSVRDYFSNYFKETEGIPCEKPQNLLEKSQKLHLSHLLTGSVFLLPEEYDSNFYFIQKSEDFSLVDLKSNIIFFNLMVPLKRQKKMPFNKYLYIDCEDNLTFTNLSSLLNKDYSATFHSKSKAPPEYSFGQIEQNSVKFTNWTVKIHNKYQENETPFRIIVFLDKISNLFPSAKLQQFQQEKMKERQQALLNFMNIFNPVLIFPVTAEQFKTKEKICEVLNIDSASLGSKLLNV